MGTSRCSLYLAIAMACLCLSSYCCLVTVTIAIEQARSESHGALRRLSNYIRTAHAVFAIRAACRGLVHFSVAKNTGMSLRVKARTEYLIDLVGWNPTMILCAIRFMVVLHADEALEQLWCSGLLSQHEF